MSVHKDKNKTWYVKYQNCTKRGFVNKRDALIYEASIRMQSENGKSTLKLYEVIDEYLAYKKTEVQYTSYVKYEQNIRIIMKRLFPNMQINRITYEDCEAFRTALYRLEYSTSMKNRCITNFKEIFDYAVRHKYIDNNPAFLLKTFKKTNSEILAKSERENNIWSYEEFGCFMDHVEGMGYKALYFTLFNTGMRLGEALALQWKDYSQKKLNITKSVTKKTEKGSYEIKMPKSISSIRTVAIDDSLNQFLLEYKRTEMEKDGFCEEWFMFGGVRPYPESCVSQRKNSAIRRSGVKKIRIHDFRHSHATILINQGMNIVAVSKRLGHSDVNITLKVYTHLLEEKNAEITDLLTKSSQNLLNKS